MQRERDSKSHVTVEHQRVLGSNFFPPLLEEGDVLAQTLVAVLRAVWARDFPANKPEPHMHRECV